MDPYNDVDLRALNGYDVEPGHDIGRANNVRQLPHDLVRRNQRGHQCFGCLCGMRDSVMIANVTLCVGSLVTLLGGLIWVFGLRYMEQSPLLGPKDFVVSSQDLDFPRDVQSMSDTAEAGTDILQEIADKMTSLIGMSCLGVVSSMVGLVGAIRSNCYMVTLKSLHIWWSLVTGLLAGNLISVAFFSLFLYPHLVYIKETRPGYKSKE